jgi:hypothetical protein
MLPNRWSDKRHGPGSKSDYTNRSNIALLCWIGSWDVADFLDIWYTYMIYAVILYIGRTESFLEEQKLFTCFLAQTLRKHTTSLHPGREVKLTFHRTTNYSIYHTLPSFRKECRSTMHLNLNNLCPVKQVVVFTMKICSIWFVQPKCFNNLQPSTLCKKKHWNFSHNWPSSDTYWLIFIIQRVTLHLSY